MNSVICAKEETNNDTNRVCDRKQSTSVSMEPSTRTRYPRQCNVKVVVEETPTSPQCSNRIPRKLTERRKNLIREFLISFLERPHMYDAYRTEPWIDSLLEHMNERPSYGLAPIDVKIWMGNETFFRDEVISILSRRRAPKVEDESASDVPAVQPHPSHIIPEILPSDPHPHNFRVKAELEELEYRVYTEIAPADAIPLTGDPLEMMPEEEPMEGLEYDFVVPLPPPGAVTTQIPSDMFVNFWIAVHARVKFSIGCIKASDTNSNIEAFMMASVICTKEEANNDTNRVCDRKQSTSVAMDFSTRTRYPRQCNLKVEVEGSSTFPECSNRIPRKLTERRKHLNREFLDSFLERPHMDAAYGTEPWIDSLLEYMNERPSYGLAPIDVKIWMGNEKFFRDEVISILSRRRAPKVENESASDVPAVQPHPSHIIREILPNDPHPHNFRVKAEPEELEYRVYTEIAPEDVAIPLTGDPLEMMPEEEPMEGLEYDFVAPLPPPRRGSYSNAFGYFRQLLDSCTRTCELLDDLKRCSHPGINMDVFYHCAHLMKHLAKETYEKQVNSFTPQ
ncbi:unnamed protein product [Orchesella dallaii]|uniref:Uncharacterized protein n=1 Tax=Orchesella dallaii TaxID=48710 RepID=A0ABP1S4V5_9HEXA